MGQTPSPPRAYALTSRLSGSGSGRLTGITADFPHSYARGVHGEAGRHPWRNSVLRVGTALMVRGLHVRGGAGEAKLVRCSHGAVFDVIVDLRSGSPTYLNWESFELRDTGQVSLYAPAGCAHGFQALTEPADVWYRIDRAHDPAEDISIAFDDPELAIPWPLPVTVMSPRDRAALPLAATLKQLIVGKG